MPGLSESKSREREGGEKGEGKTTSEGGDGVRSLSLSGDGVHACMFWCSPLAHYHLVMCDEGQACLWGEPLAEVPHSQSG